MRKKLAIALLPSTVVILGLLAVIHRMNIQPLSSYE